MPGAFRERHGFSFPSLSAYASSAGRYHPSDISMKITLIILGCLVVAGATFEIVCRIGGKREKERFDKMSPEERFRYQNDMRKAEL